MVAQERKQVSIVEAERIIRESDNKEEAIKKLKALKPRRQPRPSPPDGWVSLSEASRLFNIPDETISRWVKEGYIPIRERTSREVYIAKEDIAKVAEVYWANPGRGSWAVKKWFNEKNESN